MAHFIPRTRERTFVSHPWNSPQHVRTPLSPQFLWGLYNNVVTVTEMWSGERERIGALTA
jgi:hypothetical protein